MDYPPRMASDQPNGLGGWLILPILGLFVSPIVLVLSWPDLSNGVLVASEFNAVQRFVIYFELVSNILLQLVAPAWLLILCFRRKQQFPARYVLWLLMGLLVTLADLAMVWTAFRSYYESSGEPFWDQETTRGLIRQVIGTAIWVPYMMNSVRVRNTFVN